MSYQFNHWGVIRHGDLTEFSKPWREVSKFKESKAFFLLYISNTDFHIIQKKMINGSDEINKFRDILIAKINK